MSKEIVKTDEFGTYYTRIPFNHDAEVKVKKESRRVYWERFCQSALLIGGPIRNCVEEAVVLGLIDGSEIGRQRFAKELGRVTALFYPDGKTEFFLEDLDPERIHQQIPSLDGKLNPTLNLMVEHNLISSRVRREQRQKLANRSLHGF